MTAPNPINAIKRRVLAVAAGLGLSFLVIQPSLAAEGPDLPPAEYKPLPVGTKIRYSDNQVVVKKSDGFKTLVRDGQNRWYFYYAVFGRTGDNVYQNRGGKSLSMWTADFDAEARSGLESLWPLQVGNKAKINFTDTHQDTGIRVHWTMTLEVLRTEYIGINDSHYPSYVVKERLSHPQVASPWSSWLGYASVYESFYWYSPDAGIVLRTEWEQLRGSSRHGDPGRVRQIDFVRVTFPEGTTTHALKPVDVPGTGDATDPALVAQVEELRRQAEEAEKAEAALKARQAELEKKRDAELARVRAEAEKAREAELARLRAEAEERQKAEIARVRAEVEEQFWFSVHESKSIAAVEDYLKRYPEGRYVDEARTRLAMLKTTEHLAEIDFGTYHALVIGINDYKELPKLQMAINDAKAVSQVLRDGYGFKVKTLLNPDRYDITDALDEYRETLGPKDNLLIYYAGHGWLDEEADRGFWLPVDAQQNRRGRWVSNATITDALKAVNAKHVMVIADSCYSGTLVRAASNLGLRNRTGDYWEEMAKKWARVAITSGGLEPVADNGGANHSPFAKAFIDALRSNDAIMDGTTLFSKMRRPVIVNAEQTPQYSDVRNAGHEGGDFLFVRRR